jgi:drug/metabolite transporter (DMT)-like permease
MNSGSISASDWAKGIALSVLASIVGGVSKLAIRKSWLLQHAQEREQQEVNERNHTSIDDGEVLDTRYDLLSEGHHPINNNNNNNNNKNNTDDAERSSTLESTEEDEDLARPLHEKTCGICGPCCTTTTSPLSTSSLESSSLFHCCSCSCTKSLWFPYILRYTGMVGMSVLNPIFCVLAMNYASPSILAPFSGLTLCWVILCSPCVNNEQPSTQQILACALIIAGEVIVALFGDHTNDEGVTIDDVKKSYAEPAFVLYFVGLVMYVSVLGYFMKYSRSPILRRFAWGSCGGSITGAQNFLKDSLTIIKDIEQQNRNGNGEATPLPWFFFLFIMMAAATAFSGLLILTACMKRYDATYSAASFVGSFVVSASIMATAHYDTFGELQGLVNYILYPFGLVVLMVGVYLLVRESSDDDDDDDDDDEVQGTTDYDVNDKEESEVSVCQCNRLIKNIVINSEKPFSF